MLKASRGDLSPHFWATYAVLRTAPDQVWPKILRQRKSLLGPLYQTFFPDVPLPPKKPSQSERLPLRKISTPRAQSGLRGAAAE